MGMGADKVLAWTRCYHDAMLNIQKDQWSIQIGRETDGSINFIRANGPVLPMEEYRSIVEELVNDDIDLSTYFCIQSRRRSMSTVFLKKKPIDYSGRNANKKWLKKTSSKPVGDKSFTTRHSLLNAESVDSEAAGCGLIFAIAFITIPNLIALISFIVLGKPILIGLFTLLLFHLVPVMKLTDGFIAVKTNSGTIFRADNRDFSWSPMAEWNRRRTLWKNHHKMFGIPHKTMMGVTMYSCPNHDSDSYSLEDGLSILKDYKYMSGLSEIKEMADSLTALTTKVSIEQLDLNEDDRIDTSHEDLCILRKDLMGLANAVIPTSSTLWDSINRFSIQMDQPTHDAELMQSYKEQAVEMIAKLEDIKSKNIVLKESNRTNKILDDLLGAYEGTTKGSKA
jgi:hypothetical protein